MLPGNSSHPSLYPELDSVPLLRPRVRLGPSCRTALWDRLGDAIAFFIGSYKDAQEKGSKWSRWS